MVDGVDTTASSALHEAINTEPDELANLTPEEQVVARKLLPLIAARANAQAEANKAKELEVLTTKLVADNKKWMDEQIEKWRKEMMPPSASDISVLLSQEYAEFPLKLRDGKVEREFIIRELPLKIEIKVLKIIQKTLGARLKEFATIEWSTAVTTLEKVQRIIELVPGALETLAECCAMCLDPYQEENIDADWVLNNVGVTRLVSILVAQEKAARYRDFLSLSSRFIPGATIQ